MSKQKSQKINPVENITKSSEKVSQTINSLFKKGGPLVYTQKIEDATNIKLLQKALDIVVEKTEGKFFLLLLSCCDRYVYMASFSNNHIEDNSLSQRKWLLNIVQNFDNFQIKRISQTIDTAQITSPTDTTPFKMIDSLISASFKHLRNIGALKEEESDDEDYSSQFDW